MVLPSRDAPEWPFCVLKRTVRSRATEIDFVRACIAGFEVLYYLIFKSSQKSLPLWFRPNPAAWPPNIAQKAPKQHHQCTEEQNCTRLDALNCLIDGSKMTSLNALLTQPDTVNMLTHCRHQ